jgi:hypothetical protein
MASARVVTGALSLLALAGCTGGAEPSRSSSAVEPRDALLTKEEAVSLGAPPSIEDIEPLAASERHSEPLGPCGAELDHHPPYDEDQIALFSTIDPRPFALTHEVWVVPQDDADNHMDDLRADTEIGCDPFQVGEGDETGMVRLLEEIDIGDLGDESIAFVIEGKAEGSLTIYVAQSWVRIGGTLTLIVMRTTSPTDPALLRTIAEETSERMKP